MGQSCCAGTATELCADCSRRVPDALVQHCAKCQVSLCRQCSGADGACLWCSMDRDAAAKNAANPV